ncbi:MAG: helix-turn-helix domain-containing protein [Pseudomonadota bacterium]|nr:helix-turn-helix domain-containing protein [Pseudomonadota bacterium]
MPRKVSTRKPAKRLAATARSACPIACTLDIIGDRWSMLLIRDLFLGKRRFKDFAESAEGITPNILTERLRRLEDAGLITRQRYSEHPPRDEYLLTAGGAELGPVVLALVDWGLAHIPGTQRADALAPPAIEA